MKGSDSGSDSGSPIAEVVSSSITQFTAECINRNEEEPALPQKPRFGSFLKADSQENGIAVIAVVTNVSTGPQDSVHKPSALGMTRQELKLNQPHIFSLLKTEVHAQIVGHVIMDRVFQHLPPQPPEVHDFVYPASSEEISQITRGFEFLRLLTSVSEVPTDELIAATIREAHLNTGQDDSFLLDAGRSLSAIMRSDYDRLLAILRKIKPIYIPSNFDGLE